MWISVSIAHALSGKKMSHRNFAKKIGGLEAEVSRRMSGRHDFTPAPLSGISTILGKDIIMVQP